VITAALALAATSLPVPAAAQVIPGGLDHLKCYQVEKDANPPIVREVDLVNKFGLEPGCDVRVKARLYCTPVSKFVPGGDGDDPRGPEITTDFTCYKVRCPQSPKRRLHIDDQFGDRDIGIGNARMLCTPTELLPAD
jgi:hypothetical protein